ncbi:exodeoxyribonuclease V subunit alpha [Granulicoccus sp. GXG6511]|uniref:exodeoxyribonuclease V subunit alpha n=1 Tax=Granulicoccus sp. GXG6511 TaxID=3381351 RepID=UPI003D7CCC1E
MTIADRVLDADGLLAEFNAAEVLAPADVHTARLVCDLWAEPDDRVRLAVALVVRALRAGSVCLDITRLAEFVIDTLEEPDGKLDWPDPAEWAEAIRRSPVVATGRRGQGGQPLRLMGDLLYLERYWRTEETVRHHLDVRQGSSTGFDTGGALQAERGADTVTVAAVRRELDALFDDPDLPSDQPHHQRLAATMTGLSRITVIAGGPGTGKTTVVAKILALHHALRSRPPVVALAAPTGKAAARLEEAVLQTMTGLAAPWSVTPVPRAVTLHSLLGWMPGNRPRHDADNPLPHELVVVDEMSMVSLTQMAALLEALRPDARLVLVGDPDQLASVEAGAVLADITRAAPSAPPAQLSALAALEPRDRPTALPTGAGVVTLQHTWRFGGGIERLARAIRSGDADEALAVLGSGASDVRLIATDASIAAPALEEVRQQSVAAGRRMHAAAVAGDAHEALAALEEHRVLCAHRRGPFGVARWERQVLDWLRSGIAGYDTGGDLHPGLPIMVTDNDRDAGLYNGDTGVIVRTAQGLRAAFARGGAPMLFTTLHLREIVSVHAMTVHKSQGSQFRQVTLVLPPVESPLLTRELVYTAVTRASRGVEIIGSPEAFARAVTRPANRASGLGTGRPALP